MRPSTLILCSVLFGLAGAEPSRSDEEKPTTPETLKGEIEAMKAAKVAWREMDQNRMGRLLLSARGTEKLKFGSVRGKDDNEVAFLPAGHRIDIACGVRYGIIGEPTRPASQSENRPDAPAVGEQIPDEARKQLVEALGGPFLVFRDKVQEELKLSDEQRQKLEEKFPEYVQETMKVFEKLQDVKPPEREKAMQEHRRKSDEKLTALLKDVLDAAQRDRLFQLQLQRAGAFALLGENEAFLKLKITEAQRKQFMEVVQQMQKRIEPLAKEIESGGRPEEIMPKVMKVRREHESRIEALLTDTQRKQWSKLLGKPFKLDE